MVHSDRSAWRWYLVAMMVSGAACGSSGNRDTVDAGTPDSPRPSVVRVAPDGNDAGDGSTQPVATLARAIVLAGQHHEITDIELGAGRYEMPPTTSGSYQLPATVQRLAGPPGGGATLVGLTSINGASGLIVNSGRVQDLDFDRFSTAIEVTGTVSLANLHITNSGRGILGTFTFIHDVPTTPRLQIDNVDIARGDLPANQCVVGVVIQIDGELTISGLTTHGMGIAVAGPFGASSAPATIAVTSSNLGVSGGLVTCNSAALPLGGSKATLKDTILDGGEFGIDSYDAAQVTLQGFTLRNQGVGIIGEGSYQITDTMITGTGTGLSIGHGSWSLSGVTITGNGLGLSASGFGGSNPVTLTMRNTKVSGNRQDGIRIAGALHADLGTAASPGGNIIQGNTAAGLEVGVDNGQPDITAAGNTWNAGIQGADADGRYILVETLSGPIAASPGNNFVLAAGASLTR